MNTSSRSNSNYPLMSSHEWNNAPFNELEPDAIEFEMLCSQTLSKQLEVSTADYFSMHIEDEVERKESSLGFYADTSDTDWKEAFVKNRHYTPLELLQLFKKYLEEQIRSDMCPQHVVNRYNHLIKECSNWTEDDSEFIKAE